MDIYRNGKASKIAMIKPLKAGDSSSEYSLAFARSGGSGVRNGWLISKIEILLACI